MRTLSSPIALFASFSLVSSLLLASACSTKPASNGTNPSTPNGVVDGVPMKELTAPWKDMKLSIDGGVVVVSKPTSLRVRFPATPPDLLHGLAAAVQDDLVAQGWKVKDGYKDTDRINVGFDLPDGREGDLLAYLEDGRPRLTLIIVE